MIITSHFRGLGLRNGKGTLIFYRVLSTFGILKFLTWLCITSIIIFKGSLTVLLRKGWKVNLGSSVWELLFQG